MLARRGFAALALVYFDFDRLPPQLVEIPLEDFVGGFEWLIAQPGVRPDALGVVGISRGAELALTLGSRLPYVRSVVADLLSSVVWSGLYGDRPADLPAWTANGRSIPFFSLMTPALSAVRDRVFRESPVSLTPLFDAALDGPLPADVFIPVEQTNGPILLVSGEDDREDVAGCTHGTADHGPPGGSRTSVYCPSYPLPERRPSDAPPRGADKRPRRQVRTGRHAAMQAAANRAAWLETVAFLRKSLGRPITYRRVPSVESSPCR